jgi:hypothetical protein
MYPHERSLVKRLQDQPFVLLGVNSDQDADALRKVVARGEVTWRFWCDGGKRGPIASGWNIRLWPTIYVLDAKGVIRYKASGAQAFDVMVYRLLQAMQPSPIATASL